MAISVSAENRKPTADSSPLKRFGMTNEKGFIGTSKPTAFPNSFQARPFAKPVEAVPYHEILLVCSANQFLASSLYCTCCAHAAQQLFVHPERLRPARQRRAHGRARAEQASV